MKIVIRGPTKEPCKLRCPNAPCMAYVPAFVTSGLNSCSKMEANVPVPWILTWSHIYIWHICIYLPYLSWNSTPDLRKASWEESPPQSKTHHPSNALGPCSVVSRAKKCKYFFYTRKIWNMLCTVPVCSKKTAFQKLLFLMNFITCLAHLVTSQSYVNVLIVQGYICKNSIQDPNRFNRSTFFNGGSNPFFLGENIPWTRLDRFAPKRLYS